MFICFRAGAGEGGKIRCGRAKRSASFKKVPKKLYLK
jgi:hypothetical protein